MADLFKEIKGQQGREQGIEHITPQDWKRDKPILRHKYGLLTLEDLTTEWQITPVEYLVGISSESSFGSCFEWHSVPVLHE